MTGAPFAPWALQGEAIAALVRRRGWRPGLPDGIVAMPGPALVTALRYTSSPVGPFLEFSISVPARLGVRIGYCMVLSVTDLQDARIGARLNWGFPSEMGRLRWISHDDDRELVWEDRDLAVRGHGRGPVAPLVLPMRSLQHRGDGPVVVPGRLWGRMRSAKVAIQAYPGDELGWMAGPHQGVLVSGVHHVVREARQPVGVKGTLRAPSQAPEAALRQPYLRGLDDADRLDVADRAWPSAIVTTPISRAYSSVG